MRVVVTGSSGFIGHNLCRELRARGDWIRGIDLVDKAGICNEFVPLELGCGRALNKAFKEVDTVYHLAAKVHALSESAACESEYYRVNTDGTREILVAAKQCGVRRVVFFSTVKTMSRSDQVFVKRPLTEADIVEPDTAYGLSKLEAERIVLNSGYVSEAVVLRLCMVYGPCARGNIQKMFNAVRARRFPPVPEFGNRRSMVHVDDVVQAALLAADKKEAIGEIFIVSDGRAYSTRQIYEMMCYSLGRSCPALCVPFSLLRAMGIAGDMIGRLRGKRFVFDSDALEKLTGSAWFSSRKIESALGFRPSKDLQAALPEMLQTLHPVA